MNDQGREGRGDGQSEGINSAEGQTTTTTTTTESPAPAPAGDEPGKEVDPPRGQPDTESDDGRVSTDS
jgi:hypothetical protein